MQKQSRRSFLQKASALSLGAAGLNILIPRASAAGAAAATPRWGMPIPGFSDLVPCAAENTGEVFLALPKGFKYNVISRPGQIMSDGYATPGNADGAGTVQYGDKIRLIRNHERDAGPAIGDPSLAYDTLAAGGTTTLTIDPVTRTLIEDFVSLGGTVRNCAGGITPWGTWITCEESNAYRVATGKQHGYNFEVPVLANEQAPAVPLYNLGLLYPEAVAIDAETSIAYITQDRNPSGLFRFIPEQYGVLNGPGRLQMLAIDGLPLHNTALNSRLFQRLPVTWVDISSPTPEAAYRADALVATRAGFAQGGASFSRLEGAWASRNSIFFASTSGGAIGAGQIFELHLLENDRQVLELIMESVHRDQLDAPDNITMSPFGNNIIICEDGSGAEYLHLLRRSGNSIHRLAQNIVPGQEGSEWAGACFSPDGQTLFANIQGAGLTFAIWTENWASIV